MRTSRQQPIIKGCLSREESSLGRVDQSKPYAAGGCDEAGPCGASGGGPPAWGRGAPQARWLASQATEQEELRLLRSVGGRGFQLGRTLKVKLISWILSFRKRKATEKVRAEKCHDDEAFQKD